MLLGAFLHLVFLMTLSTKPSGLTVDSLPQLTPYHLFCLFFYFQRALNRASSFCPLRTTKPDNPSLHSFSGQPPLMTKMSSSISLWKKHIRWNMLIPLIIFSLLLQATLYEQGSRILSQVRLEKSNSGEWRSSISGCHTTAMLWPMNNSARSVLCAFVCSRMDYCCRSVSTWSP